ncbi:pentapeptide repeat-containing protein [Halostagnicola bangensis]
MNENQCGFTIDNLSDSVKFKMRFDETIPDESPEPCPRPTWREHDYCIWHAPVDGKPAEELQDAIKGEGIVGTPPFDFLYLSNTSLDGVDFSGIVTNHSDFSFSDLTGAIVTPATFRNCNFYHSNLSSKSLFDGNFTGSDFQHADLSDCNLDMTDFCNNNLKNADLSESHCHRTDFSGANLEGAILDNTVITSADFRSSKIFHTSLNGASMTDSAVFGDKVIYEKEDEWGKAISVYHNLTRIHHESGFLESARDYYYREKESQRKKYREGDNSKKWLFSEASRIITGYGDRPWRVIGVAISIILLWSVMYAIMGGVQHNGEQLQINSMWEVIDYIYFSTITFTTLGFGDFQPYGQVARVFAGVQAGLGALMLALLIFVLGRRITW